jgi:Domain of unknown function (DUF4249)
MKKIYYTLIVMTGLFFMGCREKFEPPVTSLPNSFLVVEGVLNAGQAATTIRLTRTFKLDQNATVATENNAQLTVEGKDNTTSFLFDSGNGNYVSGNLNLIAGNEYRLRIQTTDGKEYLSDYVKAKTTPLIDSISWKRDDKGVHIYANTKDPSNATRYYRWDYDETWQVSSFYDPDVIYENGVIRNRVLPQEQVTQCWKNQPSTTIFLANSTHLQSDIISEEPLVSIPVSDEKLFVRYSILVRQYAEEPDAYNFFELLKKNSEEIGSIFNPQPSEIKGNIHCVTNPAEFVVGFVTASTIEEKRIFIAFNQVSPWPNPHICESVKVGNNPDDIRYAAQVLSLQPYHYFSPPDNFYTFSTPYCVDCTTRGGSTIKPVFW